LLTKPAVTVDGVTKTRDDMAGENAIVVVPARDEARRIGACLQALAAQTIGPDAFSVIVVLDDCRDDTRAVVDEVARRSRLEVTVILAPERGSGPARKAGMDLACERLFADGRGDGLIASTDADTRPAPDWLERQLAHLARGSRAVAGRIELDPVEAAQLPDAVLRRRARDADERFAHLLSVDPDAQHHHFAGASLGVTAATYRFVGGIEPQPSLEDARFAARLSAFGVPVARPSDVVVTTSARSHGRARHGLSADLAVAEWFSRRRSHARSFPLDVLVAAKGAARVTVIIPVRECAATIAGILEETVGPGRCAGLVDELVVVDAASADGSARIARAAGARVIQQDEVAPELGPALGKGDAMWRALLVTSGDIVCFLDGDTRDPDPAHLLGLLGPLFTDPAIQLVKGAFDRPFDTGSGSVPHEGGRVTELMARPLINLWEPRLAGFAQPLAGEFAGRRDVLESLAFPVGYGVEIATLIDTCRRYGLDALAECHLGTRQNRHQSLEALGDMAYAVLAAVDRRIEDTAHPNAGFGAARGPSGAPIAVDERPPAGEYANRVQAAERVSDVAAAGLMW
jgi:glucosyl-3-phosphoglycerate synthase